MTGGLRGPDDAFFTPGGRSIITNEEFNDTLTECRCARTGWLWRYGHAGVAGSGPGYLTPDDAYRLPIGDTVVADIRNCRIVELRRRGRVRRVLGDSCVHDPPRGFASLPVGANRCRASCSHRAGHGRRSSRGRRVRPHGEGGRTRHEG